MTSLIRAGLVCSLAALALTGCGGNKGPGDGGTDGGSECFDDTQCPDSVLFFCNLMTAKCEPACRAKDECTAAKRGQYALDYCAGARGCECDEGVCVASLCSADTDCGSQVCRNGQCVEPPAASTVASCTITPDLITLRAGSTTKVWVSAWDTQKNPVVVKNGIAWTAKDGAVIEGAATEQSAIVKGQAANANGSVEVTIGTTKCTAKAVVLDATVLPGTLKALVIDELSGRAINDATVMVSDSATGAQVGTLATTGVNGVYTLAALPTTGLATVTVFHDKYNYLTIPNYDLGTASADARFLSFVLRRNQLDMYGGYKGTFTGVPMTSNIHMGIAGISIAGAVTDISFDQLLGPAVDTDIKISETIKAENVGVPAGVYLGFTEQKIKETISGQGLAGVCFDANGAPKESEIAAGTCGTRSAWALLGDVPIGDLPIDKFIGSGADIDFGQILSELIPVFRRFGSAVVRDVSYSLKPTPMVNGEYDLSDVSSFTTQDLQFAQVPLAFNFVAKVPDLPQVGANYMDLVVVLGGVNSPGRGVIPLGIGAGVNTKPVDAKLDAQSDLAPGLMTVRMAPAHHGLEGAEYGLVALALSIDGFSSSGLISSAVYARVPGNKLAFDPKGATPVELTNAFLKVPAGAAYNYTDTPQGALTGRQFRFAAGGLEGQVIKVSYKDALGHVWAVLLDPAQATTGFVLPKPPGSFADRTFDKGTSAMGSRSPMLVQGFRINDNPSSTSGAAISWQKYVELNSTNADRLMDFLTGFTIYDYDRPAIEWVTPKGDNTTIAKGSMLKLNVKNFKIGVGDGSVKITFTGGTGCTEVNITTDASGKGELSATLPEACAGSGVVMKAALFGQGAQAVLPAVESSRTANIQ
ncbi:MAG: hypothetical protein K1X64_21230 [Myxococcaceae bacterium]|nr:hypothetical protein [Myxococcaceae bacterium]